ncbi:DNA polymerase III subunit delta [Calorimonas adulescens]|uniref:DNA-directed DNA polymerase n=2 Tax=Calorimonas adulescens TaxID=2606906 RepID=A0A5D8QB61_9THEO|nr:DNA polymerase III subunit delta [Calorimonas adulescens]
MEKTSRSKTGVGNMNLKEFLKTEANQLKAAYVFNGPNEFLKEQTIDYLVKKYIGSTKAFNLQMITQGMDEIDRYFITPPMLGNKKLIVLEEEVLGEKEKYIAEILNSIPGSNSVIIKTLDIKKYKILNKVFKKAENIIQFEMLKGSELKSWIGNRFNSFGKRVDKATVDYLSGLSDDLFYLDNEIKKIVSFACDLEIIKFDDIRGILPIKLEDRVFEMVDAIGNGNKQRAMKLYRDMVLLGYNYFYIMGMTIRQYRLLFQIRALIDEAASMEEIKKRTGLADFAVKKMYTQAKRFELKDLKNKLFECLKTDMDVKTGEMREDIAMEVFISEA